MAIIGTSYFFSTNGVLTVGGTVPPTAAQLFYSNQVICQLTAGDADTTCTITHNLALTAAQQANLLPNISAVLAGGSTTTVAPVLSFVVATNTIAVTKASVVGSQGTYNVTVSRPLSSVL